ncbi:TonB-linked outer membrane protein, SusC/RagA family [Pedobacter westerhofensis]|uniref:TonB-linked outer membrane protein, SusC/RagA family n=1 Tax=Pedobacter westerhofensis TaxID=425512 RepID=A0A521CLP2_9SPHI|nr:TonB-dependent receptor [Pedobacter westerhofensis]SMO60285.1 TonB-linked outer membrane protein, SusC/RagA family [Pedobacter westerhofensis]
MKKSLLYNRVKNYALRCSKVGTLTSLTVCLLVTNASANEGATRNSSSKKSALKTFSLKAAIRISGVVTDENGETLPGVSVKVKGSSSATVTDSNGKFTITVPNDQATLVFGYIGYTSKEVPVGNKTSLKISLQPDAKTLNDVVVVGYGTQTKAEFTGSASKVSGESLKDLPVQSFDQGLAGKATGVSIGQPNGVLNNAPVIRIRGINSISLSSYPLIVVDGIPINTGNSSGNAQVANNPLGDINPADIESVNVLKDAASTAIYGSRAAAGVILITTKSGKSGKPKVNYEGWTGITNAVRLPELLNAEQFMMIKNEATLNSKILSNNQNNAAVPSASFFPSYNADGSMVDTKWFDEVYQTGVSQNHSLNVSGGSETTKYYFSTNYSKQEGIIKTNEFTRKSARFNIDHKLTSFIKLTANINYNNSLNASPQTGSLEGNAFGLTAIGRLATLSAPNVPVMNADGSYNLSTTNTLGMGANTVSSNFYNPAALLAYNTYTSENDRIIGNFAVDVNLAKGLTYRLSYGVDRLRIENKSFESAIHGPGFANGGQATNNSVLIDNWNLTHTLNYAAKMGDKNNFSLLAGYDVQKFRNTMWGAQRTGLSDSFYDTFEGSYQNIVPGTTNNSRSEKAFASIFGRVSYDFDKKYFATINYRRDGNSALGTGKKYGNFGGVSGGWALSGEDFYKNSHLAEIMNSVKLRASWGRVGNGNLANNYGSLSLYTSSLYGTVPTFAFNQGGNPDLGWETSKQTNVGADIGFFKDRVTIDVTYYNNNVDGLILNVPQSPSKGIPGNAILQNVGAMYNRGLEFGITALVYQKGNFSWNTNFNYTHNKNMVTDLFGTGAEIVGATATSSETTNITRVGYSVGSLYGAVTNGVNPANGQRIFINAAGQQVQYSQSIPTGGSRWTYLDGTAAPAISVKDYKILGNALPTFYGGFNNTFKYKSFDLGVNFTYSGGNYIQNGTKATWRDQRFWNNSTEVLTRWTTPGQVTDIPRVVLGDLLSNGSSFPISANVEKADFIRLQTASFGYRFNPAIFGKSGISSLRIYTQVFNAFLITKYSGQDPDISVNGNTNTTPGVDKNSVPQGRTFTFGMNIGF